MSEGTFYYRECLTYHLGMSYGHYIVFGRNGSSQRTVLVFRKDTVGKGGIQTQQNVLESLVELTLPVVERSRPKVNRWIIKGELGGK